MDAAQITTAPQQSTDIFSLSDQVLSDSLHFIEEVGCLGRPTAVLTFSCLDRFWELGQRLVMSSKAHWGWIDKRA